MLYLLDANTLVEASQKYYSFGQVDEYWSWLIQVGRRNSVKIPAEVYLEITAKDDELKKWATYADTRNALELDEAVDQSFLDRVREEGYGKNLTESEISIIGGDQHLVAYALKKTSDRKVVTTEKSKARAKRQHRKVPDVCADLGVMCCNQFEFIKQLGFTTRWEEQQSTKPFDLE